MSENGRARLFYAERVVTAGGGSPGTLEPLFKYLMEPGDRVLTSIYITLSQLQMG